MPYTKEKPKTKAESFCKVCRSGKAIQKQSGLQYSFPASHKTHLESGCTFWINLSINISSLFLLT